MFTNKANFSKMILAQVSVSDISQEVCIKVNEK